MTLHIEKITNAVMEAITRPKEDRQITWAYVLSSINKVASITAKVITSIQEKEDLTIEWGETDTRSLDDDRMVADIVDDLCKDE